VRHKKWWRRERGPPIKPSAQSDRNRTKFRQLLRGKCFNCLASYHLVAQCRDPTKCSNCKRYGHIAARYNRKVAGEGRRPDNISMRFYSYASPPHSKKQSHNIKLSFLECASPLPTLPNHSGVPRLPPRVHGEMERRRSLDNGPAGQFLCRRSPDDHRNIPCIDIRGSVVNYSGNPRFSPRCAHRLTTTSIEMDHRHQLLSDHAVMITDDGPMKMVSREEVNKIISTLAFAKVISMSLSLA
jgi:hypothetical protein